MIPRSLRHLLCATSILALPACGASGADDAGGDDDGSATDAAAAIDGATSDGGAIDGATSDADVVSPSASLWCLGDGVTDGTPQLLHFALGDGAPLFDFALPNLGGQIYAGDADAGDGFYGAYAVSPSGTQVAFAADLEVAGRFDLYLLDVSSASPTQVVAMTADADVERVVWSSDGQRLAIRADLDVDDASDVYLVEPGDASPTALRLSPDRPAGAPDPTLLDAREMRWSPDGDSLLFTGDFTNDQFFELWLVDTAAVAPSAVAIVARGDIAATAAGQKGAVAILGHDPVAGTVWYRARQDADVPTNLFKLKLAADDGSGSATLANSTITRGDDSIADVGASALSPDGDTLAFAADETAMAYEIWTMPADGSATPTRISSGTIVAGRNPEFLTPLAWSPAGDRVGFLADYATDGKFEPYVVPIAGGGEIRVAAIAGDATQDAAALTWAADGNLYLVADHETSNDVELFQLSPLTADQTPVKVHDVPTGGDLSGCAASAILE